ncbi:hypothetical protein [Streptomyces sp. NPDC048516]|uniref:hypothetical protein n=1 Tax=Streptomyces sp. NPDC048516 TaxID=3365565 RepID=UPI00372100A2
MPGPEAAGTTPPPTLPPTAITTVATADADVIDLHRRTRRRRSGDTLRVATQPSDPALERLAAHAEALYQEFDRTLTDPATAEAYRIALHLAISFLEGAHARGTVPDGALDAPRNMLLAACNAPDAL